MIVTKLLYRYSPEFKVWLENLDSYKTYSESNKINKILNEAVLLSQEEAVLKYIGLFLLWSMIIFNILDAGNSNVNEVNSQRYSIMLVGSGALSISKTSFRYRRLRYLKEHARTMFSGFRQGATNLATSREAAIAAAATAGAFGAGLGVTDQAIATSTGVRASSQLARLATGQIDTTEFGRSFKESDNYVSYSKVHAQKKEKIYQLQLDDQITQSSSEKSLQELEEKRRAI